MSGAATARLAEARDALARGEIELGAGMAGEMIRADAGNADALFLLALALAVAAALATKPQQAGSDLIRTDDVDYSTSAGFNVAAIGVVAILAALYAIFW